MAIYFLLQDERRFRDEITPALAASWRERSFRPCRALCAALAPEAAAFRERYFAGSAEPLLGQVAGGLPFDRDFWRLLAGEVLLYAAAEVPEVPTAPDTLRRLLAPHRDRAATVPREQLAPIEQAHFGSRDLVFGSAFYQPEYTGLNDAPDVRRLAAYLEAVAPERWSADDLTGLPGVETAEDREEELEVARDWFPRLRDVYRRAAQLGRLVVCDDVAGPGDGS